MHPHLKTEDLLAAGITCRVSIGSSANANNFWNDPMQQTSRPSVFFLLPQCRGRLDNDHYPSRAPTDFCALTLWPKDSCAAYILCSESQQDQAYQPAAVSVDLRSTANSVAEGLALFQLLSHFLQKEQRSSDRGKDKKSGALRKREERAGVSVKQRERGEVVTTDCTCADTKLHPVFLKK